MTTPHIPVLLNEVIEALRPEQCARMIDGTLGAGGHTRAMLEAGAGEVLGLDYDPAAVEIARENLAAFAERVHIVHASYLHMAREAKTLGWTSVDGILLDLGLSSMQVDTPERGFAFRHDGPLDMRFDMTSDRPTAAEILNTYEEVELANIFYRYGEEQQSRRIARALMQTRPFETTGQLASVIEKAVPRPRGRHTIHPATRVFQALRIAVNDELGAVKTVLPTALDLLAPGGRLAVISFHSLEDRIVKDTFKLASTDCICPPKIPVCVCGHKASIELVTRKPMIATDAEIAQNPRSRSAKFRVVQKL